MAGKALNKKSFYGGSETGQTPDIAMPGANEQTPISQSAPDPWQQADQQKQDNPFGAVPEELPSDVQQEMQAEESSEEEEDTEAPKESGKPSPQESFKAVREAKARAERERDAVMAQLIEMQTRNAQPKQSAPVEEDVDVDLDFNIDPDALMEGKDAKRIVDKIKYIEKQLKNYQSQSNTSAVETKIRNMFPDFEKVVSSDNIAMLNEQYPEIARSLRDTTDMYSKAAAAYSVIKNFGIHKEDLYSSDRARAMKNSQKPRPLASVSPQQGDSPLSKANAFANGMTDELKEQLRREMFTARKNH